MKANIKIIKCSEDFLWYKDFVGMSFSVEWSEQLEQWYVMRSFSLGSNLPIRCYFWPQDIKFTDKEFINEKLSPFSFCVDGKKYADHV